MIVIVCAEICAFLSGMTSVSLVYDEPFWRCYIPGD